MDAFVERVVDSDRQSCVSGGTEASPDFVFSVNREPDLEVQFRAEKICVSGIVGPFHPGNQRHAALPDRRQFVTADGLVMIRDRDEIESGPLRLDR